MGSSAIEAWAIQIAQPAVVVDHMHVMVHVVVVGHPSAAGPRAAARVPGSSARVPGTSARRAAAAAAAAAAVVHVVGVRSHSAPAAAAAHAGAAQLLVGAAPALLRVRPADLPIHQAHVAVVGQAGNTAASCAAGSSAGSTSHHPGPVAVHLHVLPHHARTGVHAGWAVSLAALVLVAAAPLLLLRRPGAEEVVQRSIAVVGLAAGAAAHLAARSRDGAGAADIALHLNLAVGQSARVPVCLEHVVGGPVDAGLAHRGLAVEGAGGVAAQRRQSGVGAALLEVAAAPAALGRRPRAHVPVAVVRHAAPVLLLAAPALLRVGPSVQPVGDPGVAVVDAASCMARLLGHVRLQVETAMPGARAASGHLFTARLLFGVGPSEVPVGVAGVTVEVMLMLMLMMLMLRMVINADNLWGGWHGHRHVLHHVVNWARHRHFDVLLVADGLVHGLRRHRHWQVDRINGNSHRHVLWHHHVLVFGLLHLDGFRHHLHLRHRDVAVVRDHLHRAGTLHEEAAVALLLGVPLVLPIPVASLTVEGPVWYIHMVQHHVLLGHWHRSWHRLGDAVDSGDVVRLPDHLGLDAGVALRSASDVPQIAAVDLLLLVPELLPVVEAQVAVVDLQLVVAVAQVRAHPPGGPEISQKQQAHSQEEEEAAQADPNESAAVALVGGHLFTIPRASAVAHVLDLVHGAICALALTHILPMLLLGGAAGVRLEANLAHAGLHAAVLAAGFQPAGASSTATGKAATSTAHGSTVERRATGNCAASGGASGGNSARAACAGGCSASASASAGCAAFDCAPSCPETGHGGVSGSPCERRPAF
mmetsp:Transcript_21016/g.49962  ORF Transcript_21016/g.49962 Transcript_21016/m.49962 type:complete len:816 (-) Transcript_21016:20-2467(-)